MTSASKFSLIMMYDDGRTRQMRISRRLVHFLGATLVILPLVGVLGIWSAFTAWRDIRNWQQEKMTVQNRMDDMRIRLERLAILENLLEKQKDVTVRPVRAANTPAVGTRPIGVKKDRTATDSAEQEEGSSSGHGTAPAPGTSSVASVSPDHAKTANTGSHIVDMGKIRVENMRARLLDRRRIRAGVDLYKAETGGSQLSGRTVFSLQTADGRLFPLSNEDAPFRISRFKKVVTTSPLPVPMADLKNARIVIEVSVEGAIIYRNTFSIENPA